MNTQPSWTPLWSTIVMSTLWSESLEVRILFVTMLAMKDANGVVHGTLEGLRRMSNLSPEQTANAVRVLESPDSQTDTHQEFEGRRIERCEGGWVVLNHFKYRDMVSKIKRREYERTYKAEQRQKSKLRPGEEGLSIREIIKKRVDEDPITKADKKAMKLKDKEPSVVEREYDLDDPGETPHEFQ